MIRPERAIISGEFGLARALYQTMSAASFAEEIRRRDLPRGRADIEAFVTEREDGLPTILAALREIAQAAGLSGEQMQPPTVVLSLDQGEELFNAEGSDEAAQFIEILSRTLAADPWVLALIAMRSDSFPLLQNEVRLAAVSKDTFTLDMMLEGSYRTVIEGPARLVDPPLKIDPQLVEALLEDVSGQDALPLLAFTLAHLHEQYAVDNEINFSGYERLGRLKGVIETSIREALEAGVARGELPRDADAQLALVRAAFIPHLVQANAAGQFIRRVATMDEIPAEAMPVIGRFAEQRLLIRDRRRIGGQEAEIVEIAHEALLRQPPLSRLLEENREFLVWRERLGQARTAFEINERGLLTGRELRVARDWLSRRAEGDIPPGDRAFITDSIVEDDKRIAEEAERERQRHQAELEAAQAREVAAQERAAAARRLARRTMTGLVVAVLLLVVASAAGGYGWWQQRRAAEQRDEALRQTTRAEAGRLAAQANMLREGGGPADKSVVLAAQAVKLLQDIGKRSLDSDLALRRALAVMPRRLGEFDFPGNWDPESIGEGGYVTFRDRSVDRVSVRKLPGGEFVGCNQNEIEKDPSAKRLAKGFVIAAATPSGSSCATVAKQTDRDWDIDLWSATPLKHIAGITHTGGPYLRLALSSDAEFLAITDGAQSVQTGSFRIRSRAQGNDVVQQDGAEFIAFSPDGKFFAATNGLWRLSDAAEQKPAPVLAWPEKPWYLAFSNSGNHLAIRRTGESKVEVWKLDGAQPEQLDDSPNTPSEGILLAVDDGGRFIILITRDGTVVWDCLKGVERAHLRVDGLVAAFSGREVIELARKDIDYIYPIAVLAFEPMVSALAGIDFDPGDKVLWLGMDGEQVNMLADLKNTKRVTSWNFRNGAFAAKLRVDISEPAKWAVSADGRRFAIGLPSGIVIGGDSSERKDLVRPLRLMRLRSVHGAVSLLPPMGMPCSAWNIDDLASIGRCQ